VAVNADGFAMCGNESPPIHHPVTRSEPLCLGLNYETGENAAHLCRAAVLILIAARHAEIDHAARARAVGMQNPPTVVLEKGRNLTPA
jgi:hypothetical protein